MRLDRGTARTRLAAAYVAVIAAAALSLPGGAAAQPSKPPAPTVASVNAKLDALAKQAEQLAERYNKARLEVAAAQRRVGRARAVAAEAVATYRRAHATFAAMVTAQYESNSMGAAGALLSSDSGQNYLQQLSMLDMAARQESEVIAAAEDARQAAGEAKDQANAALATAREKQAAAQRERARTAAQTKRFERLLATLTAAQQAAYASRGSAPPAQVAALKSVHAGSAAAQRAVDFALAQVGKPYVFGAAGPDAFDCSGLTMAAWHAGGVSLPHLAAAQYGYGTHVSLGELQPGDLVFLYSPIGHVSIYIGNGMVVSAPQPGENVKIVPVAYFASDFVGATRLA